MKKIKFYDDFWIYCLVKKKNIIKGDGVIFFLKG